MSNYFVILVTGGVWQADGDNSNYVRQYVKNYGLHLPPNFDLSMLLQIVRNKTGLFNNQIILSFKHPECRYVIDIGDESDICQLKTVIEETKKNVHLYLTDGGLVTDEQTLQINEANYSNQDFGNAVSSEEEAENEDEENYPMTQVQHDELLGDGETTGFGLDVSDEEKSDEAWSEDEYTRPRASNPFYGMAPIPDDPEPVYEQGPFHSTGPNDKIIVRQSFDTKKDLVLACKMKAVREQFQFTTKRSTKKRYEIVCKLENCSWRLFATNILGSDMFEVRSFNEKHTCSSLQIHPNHRQANTDVLGTILYHQMSQGYSRVWKANDIAREMNALLQVNVTYKQAWRAKNYAFELMLGSLEDSFGKLPTYFHNLKKLNPGTVTYIETDEEDRFEQCFFAIGCAVIF